MALTDILQIIQSFIRHIQYTDIILLIFVTCCINYVIWRGWFSAKNYPPGYYGFPIVGVLPFVVTAKNVIQNIDELVKSCGPIIRLKIGWTDMVIINKAKYVKDALKNDCLLGRPQIEVFNFLQRISNSKVLLTMEGNHWKEVRNFSVSSLRDLGFGKTPRMQEHVQVEVGEFMKVLEQSKGAPLNFREPLVSSVSNNIASLIFGERLSYDHPNRKILSNFLVTFVTNIPKLIILSISPILFNLLNKIGVKSIKELQRNATQFQKYIDSETKRHVDNFTEDDKKDFVDHLISAQKSSNLYTDEMIRGSILGFFGAGSNTVRTSVEYLLQLAAAYPDVQQEMFEEIQREIGQDREPQWSDNEKLHLVRSFIDERMRHFTVAPLGVFRRCTKDTKLCGYDIKEGTFVIYNINSVHYDEQVFDDAHLFKPKRFLDDKGHYVKNNNVIPFAIGKRACPGETFAIFEVFLYFVSILQRFKIETDEKFTLLKPSKFITEPNVMKLKFIPRS